MKRPPTTDLKFPLKYEKGKRFITRKDSTKEAVRPFDALCNDLSRVQWALLSSSETVICTG